VVDAVEGLSGPTGAGAASAAGREAGVPGANKVDSNRREEALDLGELHATGFDVFPSAPNTAAEWTI